MKYRNILILALNASVTILKVINIFYNHLREYCIYCTVVSIVFKIQALFLWCRRYVVCCMAVATMQNLNTQWKTH